MKQNIVVVSAIVMMLSLFCGKKEEKKIAFAVIGNDTITLSELEQAIPEGVLSRQSVKEYSMLFAIAKLFPYPADTTAFLGLIKDFSDQLSREADQAWKPKAAEYFYCAVRVMKEKIETTPDFSTMQTFLNSLASSIYVSTDTSRLVCKVDTTVVLADTAEAQSKKNLLIIMSSLFRLDSRQIEIAIDFIYSEALEMNSGGQLDAMVKGLLFDSTSAAVSSKKTKVEGVKAAPKENSALALKYRTQQSIQATINEHTQYLEALYRKQLKKNPSMEGIVYVTFHVEASGKASSVAIKSSQISEKEFIYPLLDYVGKIYFKPIPETVGSMTFDFPFEFRPEM